MGNINSFISRRIDNAHRNSSDEGGEGLLRNKKGNGRIFDFFRNKEGNFREKFQKYSGRASSLQEKENYSSDMKIEATYNGIIKMAQWFETDEYNFLEPTNEYTQKCDSFKLAGKSVYGYLSQTPRSDPTLGGGVLSESTRENFRDISVEFLQEMDKRFKKEKGRLQIP